jgi:hypothetical protein
MLESLFSTTKKYVCVLSFVFLIYLAQSFFCKMELGNLTELNFGSPPCLSFSSDQDSELSVL